MTVLVLGGGVSGLSTAYYLTKQIPFSSISLWEASQRTGGWIKSQKNEKGIIFEQAARTLRPRSEAGANTLNLIEELQLSNDICPIYSNSAAAKNRLIFVKGKLHALPSSPISLFKKTSPFSKPLIASFLKEFSVPSKRIKDEPIYDFMKRRFGIEVADYLMSPLICGICAGNAKEISVYFLLGKLFEYEQTYGSITKGLIFNMLAKKTELPKSSLLSKMRQEKWSVYSFHSGLETLPKKIHKVIESKGVEMSLNTKCTKIEFNKKELIIHNQKNTVRKKHLFSTILSEQLAVLVRDEHPKLSTLLEKIQSVNVAIVNLHFRGTLIKDPGFGFLVPPQENLPILGVIYDSCCFEQKGDTVLTVMMGGHWFKKYFSNFTNDQQFYEIALNHVKRILNITESPLSYKVTILEKCIPQYTVGHRKTIEQIEDYVRKAELPLSLCGMSYNGVGVNDVILAAKNL
ncbi:hypothetical protein HHI36_013260 [Cryptolaemus montrouzieri]|uniref:Protoporphyrinogen oxidase n=1 Tax=Cryptolaemus montrouzieri TaxID=559131 RepID=A0ABD2NHB3_9CUCU